MIPDGDLEEKGLLIVTGSCLRAESHDRPLAYRLKNVIKERMGNESLSPNIVVMGDLWYLNAEPLRRLPMISIGGPGVNAVSAHLLKRLPSALVVDNTLLIQMDLQLEDLRASIWGMNHQLTMDALDIFIEKDYLDRFLNAATARRH